jgi:hypothetical protein
VAEFLEVLKRLELMDEREEIVEITPRYNQNQQNLVANRGRNYRHEGQGPVRQIRQSDLSRRGVWRGPRGRGSFGRNGHFRNNGNSEREPPIRNRETDREASPRERRQEVNEEN